ncbi:DUF2877 domain-containing protein [Natronincola ferrireducens]|uniref:DUF2877 domain-containing protein n=1 Tax=Natronincola ferrireducens TaxID=393762 RepID=A0A1G9G0F6_9FIRM|nr:DUF2877 domain-containing protein [Natronincola ferrireducens]SDK94067.1 Protein of unknown function [Natronincola ferrireducens]
MERFSQDFQQINIKTGDKVLFYKGKFVINELCFCTDSSKVWNPKVHKKISITEIVNDKWIKSISQYLLTYGKKEGLGTLPLYLTGELPENIFLNETHKQLIQKSLPILEEVLDKAINGKITESALQATKLIGLGPGLTPSGDDFLVGLLSTLLFAKERKDILGKLTEELKVHVKENAHKTTFLSKELLQFACNEEFSEIFHDFYETLREKDENKIIDATIKFMELGHSSGTDTLGGIVFGIILITNLISSLQN